MDDIPYGYCHCGCGEKTSISHSTGPRSGVKGEPRVYKRGHHRRSKPTYTVDEVTGCWIWAGSCNTGGYGQFRFGSKHMKLVHHYFWEMIVGPIPHGTELHHKCENRRCVNPDHLIAVTRKRHSRAHAILTEEDVREIRALRGQETQTAIAERFHVSQAHISYVQLGKYR